MFRKYHKFFLLLAAISLMLALSGNVALADQEGYFAYTVSGGKATVTGYTGPGGAVTIPDTLGGYPVVAIGVIAFYEKTGVTAIVMPDSVETIGSSAFGYCTNLTSIDLSNNLKTINDYAFLYCTSLTSIDLPDSLETIRRYAFSWSGLTNINIPAGVSSIGVSSGGEEAIAFDECYNLTEINVASENTHYASIDGVLFNKACTILLQYPVGLAGPYTVPDGVTEIGNEAFSCCHNLTTVTFPASLTRIGDRACEIAGLTGAYFIGNAPALGLYPLPDSESFKIYYLPGRTGWTTPTWNGYKTAQWTCKVTFDSRGGSAVTSKLGKR